MDDPRITEYHGRGVGLDSEPGSRPARKVVFSQVFRVVVPVASARSAEVFIKQIRYGQADFSVGFRCEIDGLV